MTEASIVVTARGPAVLTDVYNFTEPKTKLWVAGYQEKASHCADSKNMGNISNPNSSGLGGIDQKTMLIPSFLVVKASLCFHSHGFATSTATNAPVKENMPTRAAIRTTIENETSAPRSFYVTGTITPSRRRNGLGYISTAHTQERFSALGGTDQRTMLIPSFLVVQVGANIPA